MPRRDTARARLRSYITEMGHVGTARHGGEAAHTEVGLIAINLIKRLETRVSNSRLEI